MRATSAESAAPASPSPALLVFTLGPERECARRRLLPARLGAVERSLHEQCLHSAIAAGRGCGLRVLVSSPSPLAGIGGVERLEQRGAGFGERLEHALDEARAHGAGPILVVGTDVPGLDAGHLRRAAAILDESPGRVVVGPSPDGGCYLIGFAGPAGELLRLLRGVRWCRRDTLATLLRAVAAAGRDAALLPPLADLDRGEDLERWLAARPAESLPSRAGWAALVVRLARALADLKRPAPAAAGVAARLLPAAGLAARAPPACAPN